MSPHVTRNLILIAVVAGMIFLDGTIDIAWETYAWEVYYFFCSQS
jgi:hypothetical protein